MDDTSSEKKFYPKTICPADINRPIAVRQWECELEITQPESDGGGVLFVDLDLAGRLVGKGAGQGVSLFLSQLAVHARKHGAARLCLLQGRGIHRDRSRAF
jgi:hypothetical protein